MSLLTVCPTTSPSLVLRSEQVSNQPVDESKEFGSTLVELTKRVGTLEDRPTAINTASNDYDDRFAALQATTAKQQAKVEALLNDARLLDQSSQNAAQNTLARAATTRILAAVESGAPFATALNDLEGTGLSEIPIALRDVAQKGVVTLATLQQTIPEAARAALSASPVEEDSGLGGFLKRQLGARSVQPREGNEPDAVLSQVEGAVRNGQLTEALAEAETLSQDAQAAMSDWLQNAKTRLAVTTASETLLQRLAAN